MFAAKIMVVGKLGNFIKIGYTPVISCQTTHVACRLDWIRSKINNKTGEVTEEFPDGLKNGEVGIVEFIPQKPMVVELFSKYPALGRFVVRDQN